MPGQIEVVGDALPDPPVLSADLLPSPGPHVVPAAMAHVRTMSRPVARSGGHRVVQVDDIWAPCPASSTSRTSGGRRPTREHLRVLPLVAAAAVYPAHVSTPGRSRCPASARARAQVSEEPDPSGELVGVCSRSWRKRDPRTRCQPSSSITYSQPASRIPLSTMASAVARILPSSMPGPYTFQLFHPMGGVAANDRASAVDVRCAASTFPSGGAWSHEARIVDTPGNASPATDRRRNSRRSTAPPIRLGGGRRPRRGPRDLTAWRSRGTCIEPICTIDISTWGIHRTEGTCPDVGTRDPGPAEAAAHARLPALPGAR